MHLSLRGEVPNFQVQDFTQAIDQSHDSNLPISLSPLFPKRLSLLSQSTCVGSRYGTRESFEIPFSLTPRINPTLFYIESHSSFRPILNTTFLLGLQLLASAKTPVDLSQCVRNPASVTSERISSVQELEPVSLSSSEELLRNLGSTNPRLKTHCRGTLALLGGVDSHDSLLLLTPGSALQHGP